MKNKKIIILVLFAYVCVGIVMMAHGRFIHDRLKENQQIRTTGKSLVNLVSLAYDRTVETKDNPYFLRELSHLISNREIEYLIVQDKKKSSPLVSFYSPDIQHHIPEAVKTGSLFGTGLQIQEFTATDGIPYMEFSKSIFKNNTPDLVVRLGMKQAGGNFFSLGNFIFPFQVFFFMLMALIFGYYWFFLMLKPFEEYIPGPAPAEAPDKPKGNVGGMVRDLKKLLTRNHEKLVHAEQEIHHLTARTKIIQYENHQMFQIFNCLDFGILMIDIKDTVFFINDYFLKLLDMDRETILDHSIFHVLGHEGLTAFVQQQILIEQGHDITQVEIVFPETHPGQVYLASSQSLTDADMTLFGRLVKVTDITREKESETSRQDFVNHIAHELRTPLTNIKAYNEMMMEGEISNLDMQKEFFNTINDETNRLDRLIKNILELAETEIGKLTVKKEMVKTEWLLESCLNSIEAVAQEKNITLNTQLPDNMPKISGDKEMLKAALINVLGNAVKYTPEFGRIGFSIRETPETVVFEIEDTGYGIDQADLPHIFEKFYRSENGLVSEQTGSGLGLAITAEIIKNHNGTIEVKSEPEQGSKFILTLPKGDLQIG